MTIWRSVASTNPLRRQFESMERFSIQHSKLLLKTARYFGITGTFTSLVAISVPNAVSPRLYLLCLGMHLALGVAQFYMTAKPRTFGIIAVYSTGLVTIIIVGASAADRVNASAGASIGILAAWGIGCIATILTTTRGQLLCLVLAFASTVAVVVVVGIAVGFGSYYTLLALVVLGWLITTDFGIWLNTSIPRVMRRIVSIGRAHNVERRASETEARRHRDARLLHDTALATLTLLAHSGVGVNSDAMRAQAASDRELLSRLRLGESPTPRSSGEYTLTHTAELQLGGTLDAVKLRFTNMGLTINWHGSGQLGLAHAPLDAFIYALVECIENVRRHAGVDEAHVTLSDDGSVVRGVVTDAGVGFDPHTISGSSLGFQESVVARMKDIGGTVRVFSAPGAGTTVVLEVPK